MVSPRSCSLSTRRRSNSTRESKDSDGADLVFEPKLSLAKGPFPKGSDAAGLAEGHVTVTPLAAGESNAEMARELGRWSFFR